MARLFRLLVIAAAAPFIVSVAAPAALAQSEPGVTVDPDSPAGKEYALPVDEARSNASKSKQKKSGGSSLFGEGVQSGRSSGQGTTRSATPSTSSGATGSSSGSSSGSSNSSSSSSSSSASATAAAKRKKARRAAARKRAKERAERRREARRAAAARERERERASTPPTPKEVAQVAAGTNSPTSGGGLGTTLVMAGIGLAVLLVGGLAGLFLRRSRSDA